MKKEAAVETKVEPVKVELAAEEKAIAPEVEEKEVSAPEKTEPKPKTAPKKESGKATEKKPVTDKKTEKTPSENKEDEPDGEKKKPSVKNYHISQRADGRWQVKGALAEKALKIFATQAEAIDYAKKVADNQEGNFTIHKKDGKIRKKTY